MSNFATQLKTEISRIAKKEVRSESAPLKKSSSQYRSDIAALKKRIAALESLVKKLSKHQQRPTSKTAEDTDDKPLRFRSGGFATLRKKLGLSAAEMGQLLGVSGQSVYKWEQGKARPRANQLKAIATIRHLGKKQAHAMLQH